METKVFAYWDSWTKLKYFVGLAIGVIALVVALIANQSPSVRDREEIRFSTLIFGACATALIMGIAFMARQRSRRRIEIEGDRIRFFASRDNLVVDESLNSVIQMRSLILQNGEIECWILDFPNDRRIKFDPDIYKPYELALYISTHCGRGFERIPSSTGVGSVTD